MGDISMDETMKALADAGLVGGSGADGPSEDAGEDAGKASGGLLGQLGPAGSMAVAAFVGSKLSGGKSSGNTLADAATVVTETLGDSGSKPAVRSSGKPKGAWQKIKEFQSSMTSPMADAVESAVSGALGGGSGQEQSFLGQVARSVRTISKKESRGGKHFLPDILPDGAKSVTDWLPGFGD